MIVLKELSLSFSAKSLFKGLDLQIASGEKCVLVGPSGRGKSTLLNLLMGFVQPTHGAIYIGGTLLDASSVSRCRADMAYVPQDLSLDLSTGEDLLLYPFTFKQNRSLKPRKVQLIAAVERLLLSEGCLHQPVSELSGGERQRLLIASAFLAKKPILLVDEPTSALDDASKAAVIEWTQELSKVTLLSVSHDPVWIAAMDRIIEI